MGRYPIKEGFKNENERVSGHFYNNFLQFKCNSLVKSAYNSDNEELYLELNKCEVAMPCNSECSEERYFIHSE